MPDIGEEEDVVGRDEGETEGEGDVGEGAGLLKCNESLSTTSSSSRKLKSILSFSSKGVNDPGDILPDLNLEYKE
jgi:hypothetical protein